LIHEGTTRQKGDDEWQSTNAEKCIGTNFDGTGS
jgi:hypothetical protein